MKLSLFNSIVPYKDRYALYNSSMNRVILIESVLKNMICENEKNIDKVKDIHPTFFQYMVDNKFIIDEKVDEIENIKKRVYEIDNNPNIFLLTVNPTMNCNFKCWYCYETHIKNSRASNDIITSICKFVTKTLEKESIKYFSLSFFGGEPLLFFDKNVVPLITHLKNESVRFKKEYQISFTTNGYLINDRFINFFIENDIRAYLQITFDGYKEEHDKVRFINKKRGSYDEIVSNIKKLLRYDNFFIRIRINYTNDNIYSCLKVIDDFVDLPEKVKKEKMMFDFHRVWQNDKVDKIGDVLNKNIHIIQRKGFKVLVKYKVDNVENSCYADKRNSAVINYNGDIYKCTARDFLPSNRLGFLSNNGDLVWENDSLNKRMNSKFKNKPCLSCKILPICNGGCSQHAMEHVEKGDMYCVYYGNKDEIEKVILTKIDEIIEKREK